MVRQMLPRALGLAAAAALAFAVPAGAQDSRVEIGGTANWVMSDGVTFTGIIAGDGNVYNGIGPKDAFGWNANIGFYATEQVEVGFLFSQQMSKLEVDGTTTREIGDFSVYNYHGYVAYNGGDQDSRVRPYFLFGLGATHYGSVPFSVGGFSGETEGNSQFSTTWGVGVKIYGGGNVGLKLGARWTPTYIKSDAEGWWCDPYWGCYVVGDAQYSNQFEFGGGITIRF